jgi:hypothetical protein
MYGWSNQGEPGEWTILSAKIDNTIEAVSRECADATLTSCTASVPHRILRQIEVY